MDQLKEAQAELNRLIEHPVIKQRGIAIVFEGRDGAGKSGAIKAVTEYLPFNRFRIEHSKKPSKSAMEKWLKYWSKKMPKEGEIVLFDRSWYSRSLIQRVNGWATERQVQSFLQTVPVWECNYRESGIIILKFWLSITEETQRERLNEREHSPLTYWKYSSNDAIALSNYDKMTLAKADCIKEGWFPIDFNNKQAGQLLVIGTIIQELDKVLHEWYS